MESLAGETGSRADLPVSLVGKQTCGTACLHGEIAGNERAGHVQGKPADYWHGCRKSEVAKKSEG